jgi:hypothetical protein
MLLTARPFDGRPRGDVPEARRVSDAPTEIVFLTVEVVLELHQRQLDRFDGGPGLRDRGLLESAVAQPQASFGGTYVHNGV